ncbi:hypothetical protein BZA70DRAFT_272016 [Myxozyma melibiosi]|uniref:Uncharacterized protein n=1 Tax=Myxozyma melibiosi TaxID=54550 RepID=A0ABR1FCY4_9ASCO
MATASLKSYSASSSAPPTYENAFYDTPVYADSSSVSGREKDRRGRKNRRRLSALDYIDSLDDSVCGAFHHEGPFDATMSYRNSGVKYPPVKAVHLTNVAALNAVPRASINDSLRRHTPIDNVAALPPGSSREGLRYEEEVISEVDNYRLQLAGSQWPGAEFATAATRPSQPKDNRRWSVESSASKMSSDSAQYLSPATSVESSNSWEQRDVSPSSGSKPRRRLSRAIHHLSPNK